MKSFYRLLNCMVNICLIVALVLFALLTVPRVIGLDLYVVTSGSMWPELPVGSLICVKEVAPAEILVGDNITFYMAGSDTVATHQVYEIDDERGFFRTQGINNLNREGNIIKDASPVSFDSLIGKEVCCIPLVGYVSRAFTEGPGKQIALGMGLVLVTALMAMNKGGENNE